MEYLFAIILIKLRQVLTSKLKIIRKKKDEMFRFVNLELLVGCIIYQHV